MVNYRYFTINSLFTGKIPTLATVLCGPDYTSFADDILETRDLGGRGGAAYPAHRRAGGARVPSTVLASRT